METAQENQTGVETAEEDKIVRKNSFKSEMWQHNSESLCYTIWSDNNLVPTHFKFHKGHLRNSRANWRPSIIYRKNRKHEWDPKLPLCLFDMNFKHSYKI